MDQRAQGAASRPGFQPGERIKASAARLWENPLLRHARKLHPARPLALRLLIVITALGALVLAGASWLLNLREVGAGLASLSLGLYLLAVVIVPPLCADHISRLMKRPNQDPRQISELDAAEVAEGLTLLALWRLRMPLSLLAGLAPALMLSLVRLDLGGFTAAPAGTAEAPYFQLGVRTLSAALLPWPLLALGAAAGVYAALRLEDGALSTLAALLFSAASGAVGVGTWHAITHTDLLQGPFEVLRLALVIACGLALSLLVGWLSQRSAALLESIRPR